MSNLAQWYERSGVKLPRYYGTEAIAFTTNSLGIVRSVIDDSVSIAFKPSVFSKTGGLALADRDSKRIVVDSDLLSVSGNDVREGLKLGSVAVADVVAAVHGTVFHEALHFLLSPKHLTDFLKPGKRYNKTFGAVANIVEDVYIENEGLRRYPNFGWMLFDVWTLFFQSTKILDIQKEWDGEAPKDIGALQSAVSTLCMYKNQVGPFYERSNFERGMRRILFSVHGLNNLEDRIDVVYELYDFLTQAMVKGEEEGEAEKAGKGEAGAGNADEKTFDTIASPFLSPSDFTASEEEMVFFVGRNFDASPTILRDVEKVGKDTVLVSVLKDTSDSPVDFDGRWLSFAKLTNARSTVRRVAGSPRFNGRRITAPQNLVAADDPSHYGKVFSSATLEATSQRSGLGKPQVLILVDLSGSMVNAIPGFGSKNKLTSALEAAYGALCGLERGGVSASVLGFTTVHSSDGREENTHIIVYKKFSESFLTGKRRVAGHLSKSIAGLYKNNTDSVAIGYAARQFVGSGTRIIVVISDGNPAANMYSSKEEGIEKTAKVVANLRKNGVKVFSVAIDAAAVGPCQRIYGKNDTMISDDPNVIAEKLSALL